MLISLIFVNRTLLPYQPKPAFPKFLINSVALNSSALTSQWQDPVKKIRKYFFTVKSVGPGMGHPGSSSQLVVG